MKNFKNKILVLISLTLLLCSNVVYSKTLVFSSVEDELIFITEVKKIVNLTYKQIGYDVKVVGLPLDRALKYSNSGRHDGEIVRIKEIGVKYPNLVLVDVPVARVEMVGFVSENQGKLPNMGSLNRKRVCIVKGMKIAEKLTDGMAPLSIEYSVRSLFKSLDKKMCEVAIMSKRSGDSFLKKHYKGSNIRVGTGILHSINLYHHVHKKHRALIPKIEKALRSLIDRGVLKDYNK